MDPANRLDEKETAVSDHAVSDQALPDQVRRAERDAVDDSGADLAEPVEEWPPRAWREGSRGLNGGYRQAAYVALGMFGIMAVLVLVSIWAAHEG
jgi:hypothetical protein